MATVELSEQKVMFNMISGYWLSQCVCAAAELGVADYLHESPKTTEELAALCACQPSSLGRLLAALTSAGVFVKVHGDRYELTQYGNLLRSHVEGSLRDTAVLIGASTDYCSSNNIMQTLKEGDDGSNPMFLRSFSSMSKIVSDRKFLPQKSSSFTQSFSKVPTPFHFENGHVSPTTPPHQESIPIHGLPARFASQRHQPTDTDCLLAAYDFSAVSCVADIGGGQGQLLFSLLERNPGVDGILFDIPFVIERARATVEENPAVRGRCLLVGGNFFEGVPSGADVYLLKNILRDWEDLSASQILKTCYKNVSAKSRLLIVEELLPEGFNPDVHAKSATLQRMRSAVGANHDRTESQFKNLLAECGFNLQRTLNTSCNMSILEATKLPSRTSSFCTRAAY